MAYSVVTVKDGAPVTNRNEAYALASCKACRTVALAFQVVLVVGTSDRIMPVNVAEALNVNCPSCVTTAIATQLVVTLSAQPTEELLAKLGQALSTLDDAAALGSPQAILDAVTKVQGQVKQILADSGLKPPRSSTSDGSGGGTATTPADPSSPSAAGTETTPADPAATETTPTTAEPAPAPTATETTPSSSSEPGTATTPSDSTGQTTTTP